MHALNAVAKYLAKNAVYLAAFMRTMNLLASNALDRDGKLVQPRQSLHYPPHTSSQFSRAMRELAAAKCIVWGEGESDVEFIDAERTQFVRGGWLEEYVFHIVHDARPFDARLGVEVLIEGSDRARNEFDVLSCHGNQLLFIECKTLKFEEGQFHAVCRDYGLTGKIAFPPENIMVIRDAGGAPLSDIRTPADNTLAADALLAEVRALHTSAGRPIHTGDAQVLLAEIPFVRLRDGLPREALAHPAPFASLVSTAQLTLDPPALRFELHERRVWCGQQAVTLPPALLAWYAWLAQCRAAGRGEEGFMRFRDESPERYLAIYAKVVGQNHPSLATARRVTKHGFDSTQFEQKRTKINARLAAALSLAAEPYKVCSRGQRPLTRYGIGLPPGRIAIA